MRTKEIDLSPFDHPNITIKAWTFGQETAFIDEMNRIEKKTGMYPDGYAANKMLRLCILDPEYNTQEAVDNLDSAVAGHLLLQIKRFLDPLEERTKNSLESPTKAEGVADQNCKNG